MNAKQTIVAAAVISIVPYAVMAISSRIPIRRAKPDPIAETHNLIADALNDLSAAWLKQQDEVNRHPTIERIDAILNRHSESN